MWWVTKLGQDILEVGEGSVDPQATFTPSSAQPQPLHPLFNDGLSPCCDSCSESLRDRVGEADLVHRLETRAEENHSWAVWQGRGLSFFSSPNIPHILHVSCPHAICHGLMEVRVYRGMKGGAERDDACNPAWPQV